MATPSRRCTGGARSSGAARSPPSSAPKSTAATSTNPPPTRSAAGSSAEPRGACTDCARPATAPPATAPRSGLDLAGCVGERAPTHICPWRDELVEEPAFGGVLDEGSPLYLAVSLDIATLLPRLELLASL